MRLLVLGPGAAGKTTFARAVGDAAGLVPIELDRVFWSSDLEPMTADRWVAEQTELVAADEFILDGDLGPYDVLAPRLRRADTIVLFDLPIRTCIWRAFGRSRERVDFWRWLITWRWRYRPRFLEAIAEHAPGATLHVVRSGPDADGLVAALVDPIDPGRRD